VSLQDEAEQFTAETGVPFSYIIALDEDVQAQAPQPEDAESYWADVGEPDFPTTVDPSQRLQEITPWKGRGRPGKCLLSPDMVMIDCTEATVDDEWAFDQIRALEGS
jgi:hypothetical protein